MVSSCLAMSTVIHLFHEQIYKLMTNKIRCRMSVMEEIKMRAKNLSNFHADVGCRRRYGIININVAKRSDDGDGGDEGKNEMNKLFLYMEDSFTRETLRWENNLSNLTNENELNLTNMSNIFHALLVSVVYFYLSGAWRSSSLQYNKAS